ncbi:conjugal transfer protein TraF [Shewanella colwelliana]|uniref:Conjugal transfer protein TraF n=1 Tax=Shewanella colwelliana TaxID=23 RepID=A0ABQ4P0P1_SHECO|nr:conjugal transfer protein TraF [Shewanella colwelliana]GIU41084.1 conjugal transfer protein TraF [Shewanella colwelliana]
MRFKNGYLFGLVGLVCTSSPTLLAGDFYNQSKQGWFWHEAPQQEEIVESEKELIPSSVSAEEQPPQDEKVVIDAQWLKDNIPRLRMVAISNPTSENLGAYYAAQRVMLDMSSKFANSTKDFFAKEANWLSEEHRRPTESFMLSKFKRDLLKAQKPVIEKISKQAGLWFFFSSTCPYCLKQLPIIKILEEQYGLNVLYVSLDGGIIPTIPQNKTVIDHDGRVARDFNVTTTPTTYLVSNDASKFEIVSNGVASLPKIQTSLIASAHKYEWITNSEFESVQSVKGTNVLNNGNIAINQSDIDKPGVLLNALQERIDLSVSPIGTPFSPINVRAN